MNTIGIIPARGGSKGIPKKNITPFLGEPLIVHTIQQALQSNRLDEVFVSTDDEEIASTSKEAGATVIDRPSEIAGDRDPTEDALIHTLDVLNEDGINPKIVVLLQCTSPLRRENDIDNATAMVAKDRYDSVLSACEDHSFYWALGDDDAEPINYDPKSRSMRQEIDSWYMENGSIYVMTTELLQEEGCRLGGTVGIYEMPEMLSFEIDHPDDLELIEYIAQSTDYVNL